MKKQIITVVAVALVAVILFTTYAFFLKDDGIEELDDPFYVLSAEAEKALSDLDDDGDIVLHGYDSLDDNWILLKRFAGVVAKAADFDLEEAENPQFTGVEIVYGKEKTTRIEYKDFFKYLYDGTPYAFDGESLLVNGILTLAGRDAQTFELRALEGYDTDGDTVTNSGLPFMFPALDRDKIDILSISVKEDKKEEVSDESTDVSDESADVSDESTDVSDESADASDEVSDEVSEIIDETSDVSDTTSEEEKTEDKKEEEKTDKKDDGFRTYSLYQVDGQFYFDTSIAIKYNQEAFAKVTTNCRYTTTQGKMKLPEGRTWADYGLDHENPTTAKYTIMTVKDKDGNYSIHSVFIGNKASNGVQYYARYVGGMYSSESDEEGRNLLHNFTKDNIFFLSASVVEDSICLPQTDLMEPTIVTPITATQALFSFEDIRVEYKDKGIMALAKKLNEFNPASNLSQVDDSSLSKVLSDKKNADDYSAYSKGWKEHLGVFAGFSSSDGKKTYIDAAITRKVEGGKFEVRFGLLRDEANGAYLPSKITFKASADGINWDNIENGEISPAHSDKSLERYSISFNTTKNIKYIRIGFDVPQIAQTYVVFDEIRIYGDDRDAQPTSAIGGNWKLVTPASYIPADRNYEYLDMTNFNDFVQDMGALAGDRVVGCGFSDNGNAVSTLLKKDVLAEFGLDSPARHYSYTYDGAVCDIYVSAKDEKTGKYYAYATYTGEADGKHQVVTSDVIVELSEETYPWLAWEFVEFLDHSLLSMYLVDIPEMEISFDGTEYAFDLGLDGEKALSSVVYDGKSLDVTSFKYLYQHILSIKMYDVYEPTEGDQEPIEYLRIKIHSESTSPEFVFYRVSATRCYFTVDGFGSYYALVEDVDQVRKDVLNYIAGGTVTK